MDSLILTSALLFAEVQLSSEGLLSPEYGPT